MDLRARLLAVAPVGGRQFAAFRIAFGLYLALHFAHLIPWGRELFSAEGVLADAALSPTYGVLPNVLVWWDSPAAVTAFLSTLVALSALFALGVARRASALMLWYGWACLFNRNVLISNPSIPYVGLLLLLTTLVPPTEPWRATGRREGQGGREPFYMPAGVLATAWVLLAVGYTFSGVVKLASPSWVDGTAFWHVVNNPLARTGPIRDLILALPTWVFRLLTWKALALEVLFLPLALWAAARPLVWLALVGMHLGIITLVSFADLSAGMLMVHAFTFDPRWLTTARAVWGRAREWRRPAAGPVVVQQQATRDAA
jgi:hypothetical protein